MKILQVNKFLYPKGGSETYMFELGNALSEIGHEVAYWGMHDPKNIIFDTTTLYASPVDFNNIGFKDKMMGAVNTIYSRDNRIKFASILDKFAPDIVHLHNYNYQLTPSILPEIKARGIKVVYTAHDSQLVCPYHRLYNYQNKSICVKCTDGDYYNCFFTKCIDGSYLKSAIGTVESYFYHLFDYYNKYIDVVISPSAFLEKLINKTFKNKCFIVPNFYNKPCLAAEQGTKEDFILYYGRISAEKGILDFIKIFEKINLKLIIIGDGPDVNLIKRSPIVNFLGRKNGDELFEYVKKAKFVIQPSLWYENCPMTVIESFAYGTPVIASAHSGFKELIENGVNGYLIDFDLKNTNIDYIGEQISQYFYSYDTRLPGNCYESWKNKYSKEIHVQKILNIYRELL